MKYILGVKVIFVLETRAVLTQRSLTEGTHGSMIIDWRNSWFNGHWLGDSRLNGH